MSQVAENDNTKKSKEELYAQLKGEELQPPAPPTPPAHPAPNPPAPAASTDTIIDDNKLLEELKSRGISVESLEALKPKPTPEQIEAEKQKKKADMVAFGLSTGKFKQEEYDNFIRESADKMAIIKSELTQRIKAAMPELSDADVEEKVSLYTLAHLEPTDVLRQQREAELLQSAEQQLQKKYAGIFGLESAYEQHLNTVNENANFENKVKATLPVLQKDVATVLDGLKEFEVPIPDHQNPNNTVNVMLQFNDEDLAVIQKAFLTPELVKQRVQKGYTLEQLSGEIKAALLMQHYPRLISQAAKKYNSAQKERYIAGRKGVLPTLENGGPGEAVADDLQQLYDQLKQAPEGVAN